MRHKHITVERGRAVELVRYYLSLHGVIADSAAAEREATQHIERALDEAAYDAAHGRGSAYRHFLEKCAAKVNSWPEWKRGSRPRA